MRFDNKKISKSLIFILDLIFVFGLIISFNICYDIFNENIKILSKNNILITIFTLILGTLCTLLIVLDLRRILKTLLEKNPFVLKNVKLLNKIAIECFIISGCYIVNILLNLKEYSYKFLDVSDTIIHTDTEPLIFFLAGIFILVLSVVFKEAINYKEDIDNTI